MKSLATLHALFLFVGLTYAQQNIFPLAVDTPKWCMVSTNYNGGNPMYFYHPSNYSYQKDTTVEGKAYSKLILSSFSVNTPYLIRNEGKKTFIRRSIPNQIPLTFANETLLYNFNMRTVGDSIVAVSSNRDSPREFDLTVKFVSADSIPFLGSQRRRLKVVYFKKNGGYRDAEWIEGYGDLKNPFHECYYCSDTWLRTMKLDIKGQAVYQDSTIANGCSPKRVGVSDPILTQVSVFPNPANAQITIDYQLIKQQNNAYVEIVDLLGRSVFRSKIDNEQGQMNWNVANIAQGIYYVFLKNEGKIVWQTKAVVAK